MPTCLIVQHLEPEGPYAIADALGSAGVDVDVRRVFAGDPVPSEVGGFAGVVVMGGPMSAQSDEGFASRVTEIVLLSDALRHSTPTLGVCLGAQLLAVANGGRVSVGSTGPEVGWGPIVLAAGAADDPLMAGMPATMEVLHWHWETFEPGPAAVHLASSPNYYYQAARMGPRAWALQFHLEVDESAVAAFIDRFGEEAKAVGSPPHLIASTTPAALDGLLVHRRTILARFADLVATPAVGSSL